ncbi:MAG: hypothetical protein K0R87_1939 [Pseudonocardia sp.]|nr:hypothetical protein [Pseudonocardia sp.]
MAMRPPVGAPTLNRRTRILLAAAGLLVLLLLGGSRLISFYVDWLWFGEVGYRDVFSTIVFTRILQFLLGALVIGGAVALSLWIAYRFRPVFVPVSGPEDPIARYRTVIISRLRLFGIGIPVLVGVVAGLAAQGDWRTVQQFLHSTAFNVTDPEFGIDISFYAFELPFYRWVLSWLFVAVTVSFIVALIAHYLFGGIRLTGRAGQISPAARAQLAVLAGVFVLLKAVAYYLDRYELLYSRRNPTFTGATYTDLNAVMPAKLILLFISIICAAAFFVAVFRRNLQLPAIAVVLLVLSSVLVGAAWPAVLQQFIVAPNANEREAPSIQRNIDATRQAYGLTPDKVETLPYTGTSEATPAAVAGDRNTIPNIRLLDPSKVGDTFTQFQQRRNFYGFPENLDIDRYTVDGQTQDYIVAARELNSDGLVNNQQDWINRHLVYTHGNGLVVAPANEINAQLQDTGGQGGLPRFTSIDTGTAASAPEGLRVTEPRIYYGELITDYSIVGAEDGAAPREYDSDTQSYTYTGRGGVPLGNLVNRLVFSLVHGERNILFNASISDNSKIMYVRNPADRVKAVAPWLTLDTDPYPAVVDGRVTWIVDGYTTLANYPYAERMSLGDATATALQGVPRLPDEEISYIRNSVKATVDAYDGTVTVYGFDETDPVLRTWASAFPDVVKPASAISDSLRSHLRYPEDMFKVQRELLTEYHVDTPGEFFSTVSFWDVPSDPTVQGAAGTAGSAQPPYYLLAGLPNQDGATFQLTSALVSRARQFLSAYVSASSDPANYGKLTVLELPAETQTLGPQQVQAQFLGSPQVSQELNLLRQNQTTIEYGNLLTLPVAGGLLYVEPVYIERAGQSASYPVLARVLVSYNGRVGYSADLAAALEQVFGAGAGTAATAPGAPAQPAPGGLALPAPANADQAAAAAEIGSAISQLRSAQQSGDFAAQGQALQALDQAVQRYQQSQAAAPAAAPAATPGG